MTGNGGDPRLQALAAKMRDGGPIADQPPPAADAAFDDLVTQIRDTAAACRNIARYSNEFAEHLERATKSYVASMHKLMGKITG
jgi:hypothetical protein